MNLTEIHILSPDDKLLVTLTEETGLISAPFREELNRIPDQPFSFIVESDIEESIFVVEENQVVFKDKDGDFRLYVIKELNETDNMNGPETEAVCLPAFSEELREHIVVDRRFSNQSAQNALSGAVEGTRWIAVVDGEFGLESTNFYYETSIDAVWKVRNTWGGDIKDVIEFEGNDISARKVKLLQRLGTDRGKRFEIDHDIEEIQRTILSYPVTALYGRGASLSIEDEEGNETGGHTRYINFADVEWRVSKGDPVDKPLGQHWVSDPGALQKYGRWHNGKLLHREGTWQNSDIEDPLELLKATWDQLQRVKEPEVNYRLTAHLLEHIAGYEHEKVSLGDTTRAINRRFARPIEIQSRVIALEYDLLDIEGTALVELGQFLSVHDPDDRIEKVIAKVNERSGVWDNPPSRTVTDDSFPDIIPNTPSNFEASGGFQTVILSWDYEGSSYIKHYEIFASEVPGFIASPETLVFRGKTSGYNFEGETGKQYYFRIRAVNYHGNASPLSNEVSASTVRILTEELMFNPATREMLTELELEANRLADLAKENAIQYTEEELAKKKAELESEIAAKADATWVNGQLQSKADKNTTYTKTEVDNAVNSRVSKIEYQTDQQGVITRFESAESRINQTETEIQSKVSRLEYDSLQNRVGSTESTIQQQATQIALRVEKNNVISEINQTAETITINAGRLNFGNGALEVVNGNVLIRSLAVGTAAIANAAITSLKLANLAVATGHIQDGSITNAKIGNLAVDNAKIADGTITNAKIANLDASKITTGILNADRVRIGSGSSFDNGYDPTKISVGGANLIRNSRGDTLLGWVNWGTTSQTLQTVDGFSWIQVRKSGTTTQAAIHTPTFDMRANEEYTISFDFRSYFSSGFDLSYLYLRSANGGMSTIKSLPNVSMRESSGFVGNIGSGEGLRVHFTFSHNVDVKSACVLIGITGLADNAGFIIKNIKIEKGNRPTSWQPSSDEIQESNELTKIWTWGNTTEIDGGKIRTNTVTANQINVNSLSALSADLGTVTAGTLRGVTIEASEFNISSSEGTTFRIDNNGRGTLLKLGGDSAGYTQFTNLETEVRPNGFFSGIDTPYVHALIQRRTMTGVAQWQSQPTSYDFVVRAHDGDRVVMKWGRKGEGDSSHVDINGDLNAPKIVATRIVGSWRFDDIIRDHQNGNVTVNAQSGTLFLGHATTNTVRSTAPHNFTSTTEFNGQMNAKLRLHFDNANTGIRWYYPDGTNFANIYTIGTAGRQLLEFRANGGGSMTGFNAYGGGDSLWANHFWIRGGGSDTRFFTSNESTPHHMVQLGSRILLKALNGSTHQLQIRNVADSGYLPVVASEFITSSTRETKKNIELYEGGALQKIVKTPIYQYHKLEEDDREIKHLGVMYEESPVEIVSPSGVGVDSYAMSALAWKAIQQLDIKDKDQDSEIEHLKNRVKELEEQISNLNTAA